jgi:hypothetical protein
MYKVITENNFMDQFESYGRRDQFSYEGKKALFNYLEELEEETGETMELDIIALCCEYTEYSDIEEFHADYDKADYPDIDAITDTTQYIEIEGSEAFIILAF